MKKRKFRYADGGETPTAGRFDEDTYARARRFIEEQERRAGEGKADEETSRPVARTAPKVAAPAVSPSYRMEGMGRGRPDPAQIPVDTSMRGPAKQFSPAMEMSDTGRNIATTLGALGGMGRAVANLPRAAAAAQTAKEMGRGMAAPAARAAKEGLEVAAKSGPRAGMQTALSTSRGMRSRADIQTKRAARQKAEAEAMEKAKPILQTSKSGKAERAAGPRRSEEDMGIEFSKGGSASKRADGCCKRGKTRGKVY
jgi:hypothetical protein